MDITLKRIMRYLHGNQLDDILGLYETREISDEYAPNLWISDDNSHVKQINEESWDCWYKTLKMLERPNGKKSNP